MAEISLKESLSCKKKKTKRKFLNCIKRDYMLYIFLILPMLYYIIFCYVPMYGIVIAFKDYNLFQGIFKSKWVGLDVFKEIFKMKEFYKVLRNTLVLNILDLICGFPAPIIFAIIISELPFNKLKKFTQTIVYLPHFISWIIIGGMVYQIFSNDTGMVNSVIKALGGNGIPFLSEKWHWLTLYISVGVWQSTGWGTIIYLAAITSINSELYEAADVDGAGRLRKIWNITLPGIKSTIIILLILNMGRLMSISFDRPFVMGNSLVSDFSNVISTFVYTIGLQSSRFNVATAVGLFQSVIGMILLLITNFIAEKSGEQGIW